MTSFLDNMYFGLDGQPITREQWAQTFDDIKSRRIGQQTVGYGPGKKWVSTVWLGLNHQFGDGLPLIFESMVFQHGYGWRKRFGYCHEVCQERYPTKQDAIMGHRLLVEKYTYNRKQRRKRLQYSP